MVKMTRKYLQVFYLSRRADAVWTNERPRANKTAAAHNDRRKI